MQDDLSQEVESAVAKLQELDSIKQQMLQALRDQDHDVGEGQVFVAHNLSGEVQVDNVGPA
jgi:hypothetical protein